MNPGIVLIAFALGAAMPAIAEIESVATTESGGVSMRWWPKVQPPKGWKHDREHSVSYSINAMAPAGKSFGEAQTVMYAKAIYKPRERDLASVDALIERDKRKSLERDPKLAIGKAEPLKTADGKVLQSVTIVPRGKGNWERVSYGEEGDFYLIFAVSSRTQAGYESAMRSYEQLVRSYKEKP